MTFIKIINSFIQLKRIKNNFKMPFHQLLEFDLNLNKHLLLY